MPNPLANLFKSMDLEHACKFGDVPHTDLATLAAEQGVQPVNFDALLASADFWPENESVDDFIATVQKWRNDDEK